MLGEIAYLKWIFKRLGKTSEAFIGPGDDCAAVLCGGEKAVIVTTDMLLEGTHFEISAGGKAVGRKTVAVSLSDCAAMGVRPAFLVVSVGFGVPTEESFACDLVDGMKAAADEFGTKIVGGDVTSWKGGLTLASTAFGFTKDTNKLVKRSTAKKGDSIYVTGSLGGSILGSQYTFTPRVEEGVFLAENAFASSMMDISDGLSKDLKTLAEASGVGALIHSAKIPASGMALQLSEKDGLDGTWHAIFDGEDFELLFTVPPAKTDRLEKEWPFDTKLTRIGKITDGEAIEIEKNGEIRKLERGGYEHHF